MDDHILRTFENKLDKLHYISIPENPQRLSVPSSGFMKPLPLWPLAITV